MPSAAPDESRGGSGIVAYPTGGSPHFSHRQRHGSVNHTRRGFSFIEMMIVLAIMAILMAAGIPFYREGVRNAREVAAMRTIGTVHTAQAQYYSLYGKHAATLAELGPPPPGQTPGPSAAKLIPRELAGGEKGGYRYRLTESPEGYVIHAEPVKFGDDGGRTFYSDETMAVLENRGPEPATRSSPEAK
jgi:prepilin-type N-terminal cleavage/methylation domain-containing protein